MQALRAQVAGLCSAVAHQRQATAALYFLDLGRQRQVAVVSSQLLLVAEQAELAVG